ncbi:amphi-Trp domain-containing protein [Desulfatitalea tepidiphila]|uniref:amphi-Trp domain-containing protein n=1 Tax=Desulfatitalea tepidiphila TaxID=1185843 RepID=UPI0006B65ECF|nr:amphi-Trp domain-containing protein [Desulfatitalea tepidiphila]
MAKKKKRDLEKSYPTAEFVAKLRRFADALESGRRFRIQIAGERISVPAGAVFNIEHEREGNQEEIEFQIKWTHEA